MKRIRNNIKGWGEIRGGLQCVTRERQRYSFVCVSVSVLCECERFCLCLCVQGILSYRFRKYNIQSIISHVVRIRFVIHELMQEAFVFFFYFCLFAASYLAYAFETHFFPSAVCGLKYVWRFSYIFKSASFFFLLLFIIFVCLAYLTWIAQLICNTICFIKLCVYVHLRWIVYVTSIYLH